MNKKLLNLEHQNHLLSMDNNHRKRMMEINNSYRSPYSNNIYDNNMNLDVPHNYYNPGSSYYNNYQYFNDY